MGGVLKRIIVIPIIILMVIYATGVFAQAAMFIQHGLSQYGGLTSFLTNQVGGMIGEVEQVQVERLEIRWFHPVDVFMMIFSMPYNWQGGIVTAIIAVGAIAFFSKNNEIRFGTLDKERNLINSAKGTHGTARFMSREELAKGKNKEGIFEGLEWTADLNNTKGTILGNYENKAVVVPAPEYTWKNRNVFVLGSAGTGKSRAYVRNLVFQSVRRGESLIITDPSGELYLSMASYLKEHDYEIKQFNLVSQENSDIWNCLQEIEKDNQEFFAQLFCDIAIRNTLQGSSMDPFWDNNALALLKALCLLVANDPVETNRNMGFAYQLLANAAEQSAGASTGNQKEKPETELDIAFSTLEFGHPAKAPYMIFRQSPAQVQAGTIIGLANKLQVFQIETVRRITGQLDKPVPLEDRINLIRPGKQKCAYFCIMSDQDGTFQFLSSLFISFLFIKLVRFAQISPGGYLPVPVHFLADELANIGTIPDLGRKISTVRKYKISLSAIFQNTAQMENRYPNMEWLEIVSGCDTQLFLGCNEMTTAEYISSQTGDMTVGVESEMRTQDAIRFTNFTMETRESNSVGKRLLMTPHEVRELDGNKALVFYRGFNVLKVDKFDYSKHPESKHPAMKKQVNFKDYIPQWRIMEKWGLSYAEKTIMVENKEGMLDANIVNYVAIKVNNEWKLTEHHLPDNQADADILATKLEAKLAAIEPPEEHPEIITKTPIIKKAQSYVSAVKNIVKPSVKQPDKPQNEIVRKRLIISGAVRDNMILIEQQEAENKLKKAAAEKARQEREANRQVEKAYVNPEKETIDMIGEPPTISKIPLEYPTDEIINEELPIGTSNIETNDFPIEIEEPKKESKEESKQRKEPKEEPKESNKKNKIPAPRTIGTPAYTEDELDEDSIWADDED